jgi:RHS repeat-associated protein
LYAHDGKRPDPIAYTPYGHRTSENGLLSLLGFNGERRDSLTGHYHLGNGYRQFNPVLMRFNSPDSWSPFEEGGLNAYAYCEGDPRNRVDPTGHGPISKIPGIISKGLMEVSKKVKVSRPLAASDELSKGARSSSQVMDKRSLRKSKQNELSRKYHANNKKTFDVIRANEASQGPQDQYNVSDELRDLNLSTEAYEIAKKAYGFKRFPDPNQRHDWTAPQGNKLLDVAHFDIAISHYINSTRGTGNVRSNPMIHRLNIRRAQYIKNFTRIDLMAIRR